MKRYKLVKTNSYKVGMNEVQGLKAAMLSAMKPVVELIQGKAYWTDKNNLLNEAEYTSRDGFIAHSHNCGGIQLDLIVPKCEEYEFSFLDFGECDDSECECRDPNGSGECGYDTEGHLDAFLRVWLKFEGVNPDNDKLQFYITVHGGNGDAPYFRTKYSNDYFEASFEVASVAEFKKIAPKHLNKVLKLIGGGK